MKLKIKDLVSKRISIIYGSGGHGTPLDGWTEDKLYDLISAALTHILFDIGYYYNEIEDRAEKKKYWDDFHLVELKKEMKQFHKYCTYIPKKEEWDSDKLVFKYKKDKSYRIDPRSRFHPDHPENKKFLTL